MPDWLNNPWVVGVGGGILSGLLVTLVTRFFLSRRDRRVYNQKLQSANREIVYALRPGISEGQIADRHVVESLVRATARKHSVADTDLHTPSQIVDELTKEIMDSSFISSKAKRDYCNHLEALTAVTPDGDSQSERTNEDRSRSRLEFQEYRTRMVTAMSVTLGIITAMMTMIVAFYGASISADGPPTPVLAAAFVSVSLVVVSMMVLVQTLRRRVDRESQRKQSQDPRTQSASDPPTQ